ncbi:MAG: hypothetical protein LKJ05_06960 [Bifidobacteriaceae bacterium]|jgi:phosphoglycerol transferase MdoB-like AlkP superfamily enzyme|nr:hypothetical protein [Bifidobacteriaceae bacterium]
MGILDDAKDLAKNAGEKISEKANDVKEAVADKVDEKKADANVEKAKAEKVSVHEKNKAKEQLRDV